MELHAWRPDSDDMIHASTMLCLSVLCSLCACRAPDSAEPPPQAQPEHTAAAPREALPDAVEVGRAFYAANACAACHIEGALIGLDAALLLAFMDGTTPHAGGEVDGVTPDDAAALAAFLGEQ